MTLHDKTDFARRVTALGITIAELAEITGYKKKSLYNYSCGHQKTPLPLIKQLERLEAEKAEGDKAGVQRIESGNNG